MNNSIDYRKHKYIKILSSYCFEYALIFHNKKVSGGYETVRNFLLYPHHTYIFYWKIYFNCVVYIFIHIGIESINLIHEIYNYKKYN